jgi:hypothetical protein
MHQIIDVRGRAPWVRIQRRTSPKCHSLFVSDFWASDLVKVDVETGVATTVAGPGSNSGEGSLRSLGLALDHANHRALVQPWGSDVLLGIDLETGDRHVVSAEEQGEPAIMYTSGRGPAPRQRP